METKQVSYLDFKSKQEKVYNEFISKNVFFAFDNKQFEEGLAEFGLTLQDDYKAKFTGFIGGGFILRDKVQDWVGLSNEQTQELKNEMETNFEFAKSAFNYELGNYETYYSWRFDEAVSALGYSMDEIDENEHLKKAFMEAKHDYWTWCNKNL